MAANSISSLTIGVIVSAYKSLMTFIFKQTSRLDFLSQPFIKMKANYGLCDYIL